MRRGNERAARAVVGTVAGWGRLSLCVVPLLVLLALPHQAAAMPPGWSQVTVTEHGVRLTLFVRRRAYPRNALVRVWARVQNVTSHTLRLYDDGPMAAGKYIPQPIVRARRGGKRLPISLTDYVPFPGPTPFSFPIVAGAVRNTPELIIVRGSDLQLRLTLAGSKEYPAWPRTTLSTPLLHVHLTSPDTPTVTLRTPPDHPKATITPAGPVQGHLLGVWYWACSGGFDSALQENIDWRAIGQHIAPACSPLVGWHEIVGWLNHSVADIDWGEQ